MKFFLSLPISDLVFSSFLGAFRRGKSFLLDFLLRYLSNGGKDDWLGSEDRKDDVPLTGFHWRGGADRDTTGTYIQGVPAISTHF